MELPWLKAVQDRQFLALFQGHLFISESLHVSTSSVSLPEVWSSHRNKAWHSH